VADASASSLEPLFAQALEDWQSLRGALRPEDVAPAVVWLAGDAAHFVTGHDLVVDGGVSTGRPISVSIRQRAQLAEAMRVVAGSGSA
jgi:NAD(P)-dependent dehydrogenase (short-subunit alcohol dehydrogenase family)